MLKRLALGLLLGAAAAAAPDLRQVQVPAGFKVLTLQRKVHGFASALNCANRVAFADRSRPAGYGRGTTEVFARDWLRGASVSGRPVDVQEMSVGALVISDDDAGCLYRLSYGK